VVKKDRIASQSFFWFCNGDQNADAPRGGLVKSLRKGLRSRGIARGGGVSHTKLKNAPAIPGKGGGGWDFKGGAKKKARQTIRLE